MNRTTHQPVILEPDDNRPAVGPANVTTKTVQYHETPPHQEQSEPDTNLLHTMKRLLLQALRLTAVFTVLTGIAYPLVITGVAQLVWRQAANGSLMRIDGRVVGSALLAQPFTSQKYFWPRPSAGDYSTVPSGASNKGPTSADLQKIVEQRAAAFRSANKLTGDAQVPADMVFASGSGLDPDISPEAARLQVARVAAARGSGEAQVAALVEKFIKPPQWGVFGEPRVNVLLLNQALDRLGKE
jgi:potassium-transporting ATPase KdpC subunit